MNTVRKTLMHVISCPTKWNGRGGPVVVLGFLRGISRVTAYKVRMPNRVLPKQIHMPVAQ